MTAGRGRVALPGPWPFGVGLAAFSASAGEVSARRHAQDRRELRVLVHPALDLRRVLAVSLQRAVDRTDRLAEAGLVHHRVVARHRARPVPGVP